MSEAPTGWSGPSWFRGRRRLVMVVAAVLVAIVVGALAIRASGGSRVIRPDLGPGPVRGVRLTEFRPGEGAETCTGVGAELPVVRLVEQVDVERIVVCLGPGRFPGTLPLEPYVLDAASPDGERLLDAWAAAWSLPDEQLPWWQNPDETPCPAIGIIVPASAITVAGVIMRPVPPSSWCQPLPAALDALADIAQAARPAP